MSWVRKLALVVLFLTMSWAHAETFTFGVLNQRSPTLTAQYWNPILDYVGKKTGVTLVMRMGKDVQETDAMTARGDYDFLYSNHVIFSHQNDTAGYRIILRPNEDAIEGQIVVPVNSPITSLSALQNKEVGFPSKTAFVGYMVPMDHLLKNDINVKVVLGGNQEGIMAQLKAGTVVAAAVNSRVMGEYAARTGFQYRVLWTSPGYRNLPISVSAKVPPSVVGLVSQALDKMDEDPIGHAVLKASADVIHQSPPYGFRASSDKDYSNYVQFYKATVLKDVGP